MPATRTAPVLVSAMAIGDFVSRLGTGYLTDRHYITREWMLIINFTVHGVCYALLANLTTVAYMAVVGLVFGLNNGPTIASMPVLIADHLDDEHLPLAFGLHRLTMGMATLFRPLLIGGARRRVKKARVDALRQIRGGRPEAHEGPKSNFDCERECFQESPVRFRGAVAISIRCFAGYFKDKQGSYNGLYYLVAGACAAVVVLWCIIVTASSIKSLFLKRPAHENDLPMPA
ncbi:hypothetical protein HPB51_000211 [Rhipicephalus microplus]|uniref:Monocarboxylate transporter n=1 Tax=Rhipicephalus microplus TaxID=6941 RepID=A0A9J6EQR1_RHIMP|nr:hypothetical protein HPB51_000211 [Rhipicephalus microplus]